MKSLILCAAVCLALIMALCVSSYAWLFEASSTVNSDSNNYRDSHNDRSLNVGDSGRYSSSSNTNSFNSYNNQRYDNRQDRSMSNSFNSYDYSDRSDNRDMSDRSLNASDNRIYDSSSTDITGGAKRVNSSDITIGGQVTNSIMGNFNQLYSGTDFRSGVNGSGNSIDTSSINITTLGDAQK